MSMTTAIALLPADGDSATWSPQERALVEAAGLVRVVNKNTGEKALADRPTVEAFLAHCRRTALDPIGRQIYCIYRGGKWQIQVSIDGARLVAERTGKYEGQTDPEWSNDGGVTWSDAWSPTKDSLYPTHARVGVFKTGLKQPMRVTARWESYAVMDDVWDHGTKTGEKKVSSMWAKMPDLMLAKVAEMLALRKAFPQDLSGLYSSEEMAQAGPAAAVDAVPASQYMEAPVTQEAPIAPPTLTKDWAALAAAAETVSELTALANEADGLGEIGITLSPEQGAVIDVLRARRSEIEAAAAVTPPLVEAVEKPKGKRQWVREARLLASRREVHQLYQEALAAGALAQVLEELGAIENTLPDPDAEKPAGEGGWAEPVEPKVTEWEAAPIPNGEQDDTAGVLDATIDPDEVPF